ncbi:MAG: 4Fe-4S binding protein, partial [Bacteroidaceae bacterium]|nr:4Fe-4S binding protein [Bacteroidaceae bacterium]
MIFYYSGCGNSRWVAEELAAALHEELSFIPDLQRAGMTDYTVGDDEAVGFVFPVYAWAAPKLVEDFVRSVRWQGSPRYVWFACTCGDEMGLTHRSFGKVLAEAGLPLSAAFCLVMPETYLCFPGFHLDTPEKEQRKLQTAREKLPHIAEQVKARAEVMDLHIGPLPRLKSYVIRPLFLLAVTDKKYHTTEACTGCGTCVRVCPLHNIRLTDRRPQWQGDCTQCMACYHHCPQNAIHFGSLTHDKGQYFFHRN